MRSLVLDLTSPANARILYAGVTSKGMFQSNDGGQTWTSILSGATTVVANELNTAGTPAVPLAASGSSSSRSRRLPLRPQREASRCCMPRWRDGRSTGPGKRPTHLILSGSSGAPIRVSPGHCKRLTTRVFRQAPACRSTHRAGIAFTWPSIPPRLETGSTISSISARSVRRSTDSGLTFTALSGLHADTHAWTFAAQPGPFSIVYCGNDGGIFKSTGGTAFTSLNGGGLQTALFYNLDVKRDATASVTLGALQDNGIVTNRTPPPSRAGRLGSAATVQRRA